jgi:Domain of unknown function (DUF4124)/Penicillin-Binding Protein C-terminus Family
MSRLLLLALLMLPLSGLAQAVYRTTDAQGNVVFTDSPPANATPADRVEIRPTNTVQPPQIPPRPVSENTPNAEAEVAAYILNITEPVNETTIPMGPGNFSVSVNVSPTLQGAENLQLFLDGAPQGKPQRASTWSLTNVYRGQHDLTVGVIDGSGKTLAISPPVRVFVQRPSLNSPSRSTPPAKPKPPRPQPINN